MGVVGGNHIKARAYNARGWADTQQSLGCDVAALPECLHNHRRKALPDMDGFIRRDRDPAVIRKQHAAAQPGPCLSEQRRVAFQSL